MRFSKWHALGNAYLLVERADAGQPLTAEQVRELVRGSDGVVEVVGAGDDEADVVIWNADGSIAELSGNGTRIAGRWLSERTGAEIVRISVGTRVVVARMLDGGLVEQELGQVELGAAERLDVGAEELEFVPVVVGNPHAVIRRDPERSELVRLGPLVEHHPRFPQRTNVELARVDGPGDVTAVVWERGVGETTSSGTGAVAVAAATHAGGDVVVHFPGGDMRVRLDGRQAWLTGPAELAES